MEQVIDKYDLTPTNGRKSFYGKAKVFCFRNGDKILQSYSTKVIKMTCDGKLFLTKKEFNYSTTTSAHIKSFCGLNKSEAIKLPRCEI